MRDMLDAQTRCTKAQESENHSNTVSSGDIFRHYYNEYQRALDLRNACQLEAAQNKCRELEFDFECPRLIQVQACQLGSRCTMSYWSRKTHLEHGNFLLSSMNATDQVVIKTRQDTAMLAELEEDWRAHWEAQGLPVPVDEAQYWQDVDEDAMEEDGKNAEKAEDTEVKLDLKLQELAIR